MNRVRQPHTLLVLGLNAEMRTTAGADELVEIPAQKLLTRTKAHPLHLSTSLEQKGVEEGVDEGVEAEAPIPQVSAKTIRSYLGASGELETSLDSTSTPPPLEG